MKFKKFEKTLFFGIIIIRENFFFFLSEGTDQSGAIGITHINTGSMVMDDRLQVLSVQIVPCVAYLHDCLEAFRYKSLFKKPF